MKLINKTFGKAVCVTIAAFVVVIGWVSALSIVGMPDWYYGILFGLIIFIPTLTATYTTMKGRDGGS